MAPPSLFERFDDWLWYDGKQEIFERQANSVAIIKNGYAVFFVRFTLVSILMFHLAMHIFHNVHFPGEALLYLTVWGFMSTIFAMFFSLVLNPTNNE